MSNLTAELALCDALRAAQLQANALDNHHAYQRSTYGAIGDALLKALTVTLEYQGVRGAEIAAERIYDATVDNGESVTYNYRLFVEGVISV